MQGYKSEYGDLQSLAEKLALVYEGQYAIRSTTSEAAIRNLHSVFSAVMQKSQAFTKLSCQERLRTRRCIAKLDPRFGGF